MQGDTKVNDLSNRMKAATMSTSKTAKGREDLDDVHVADEDDSD